MIYYEIRDKDGVILFGNSHKLQDYTELQSLGDFKIERNGRKLRGAKEVTDTRHVWVVSENDDSSFNSSKVFRKTFELVKHMGEEFFQEYTNTINSQQHTLVSIHAQMLQKLDDLFPRGTFYADNYDSLLSKVSKVIAEKTEDSADVLSYLYKRVTDFGSQLFSAQIMKLSFKYEPDFFTVSLKRAILNQLTPFQDELNDLSVKVKFFFDEDVQVIVDKQLFSLIMYNFLSNAAKYVKENTEIRFSYHARLQELDVSMVSRRIDKDELSKVHDKGVRSKNVSSIAGSGIGLYVIGRALFHMKKKPMYIYPKYESELSQGLYTENHFKFLL